MRRLIDQTKAGGSGQMNFNHEGFTLQAPVTAADHWRGGAAQMSSVVMVVYGDYTDVASRAAHGECDRLCQMFSARLCLVYRHFPRSHFEPRAAKMAEAAEAAGAQNKFWEMHECLYQQAGGLENGELIECVTWLGLDLGQFLRDLREERFARKVRNDYLGGVKSNVNATPAFFIGQTRHTGAHDFSSLCSVIERAIGGGK